MPLDELELGCGVGAGAYQLARILIGVHVLETRSQRRHDTEWELPRRYVGVHRG
jgi:hypothetical protein